MRCHFPHRVLRRCGTHLPLLARLGLVLCPPPCPTKSASLSSYPLDGPPRIAPSRSSLACSASANRVPARASRVDRLPGRSPWALRREAHPSAFSLVGGFDWRRCTCSVRYVLNLASTLFTIEGLCQGCFDRDQFPGAYPLRRAEVASLKLFIFGPQREHLRAVRLFDPPPSAGSSSDSRERRKSQGTRYTRTRCFSKRVV